jgi:REP element-mobilizing transposase RayT
MTFPKRKNSLRLEGYNYAQEGAYFVTILAYRRLHIFGSIENDVVTLTKLGEIIESCWQQIPQHFPSIELDVFVIMPNHLHGVLVLHNDDEQSVSLSHIIGTFKGSVTRNANKAILDIDLDFPIWHRSFHDRIIRNEREYNYIAHYVATNPERWQEDSLNI